MRSALDGEKENARKMAQELLRQRRYVGTHFAKLDHEKAVKMAKLVFHCSLISFGLDSLKKEEEVVHRLREVRPEVGCVICEFEISLLLVLLGPERPRAVTQKGQR